MTGTIVCPAVYPRGCLTITFPPEPDAEVVVLAGMVRPEANPHAVFCEGPLQVAFGLEHNAEVGMCGGIARSPREKRYIRLA